jgi:hypothetical protein
MLKDVRRLGNLLIDHAISLCRSILFLNN